MALSRTFLMGEADGFRVNISRHPRVSILFGERAFTMFWGGSPVFMKIPSWFSEVTALRVGGIALGHRSTLEPQMFSLSIPLLGNLSFQIFKSLPNVRAGLLYLICRDEALLSRERKNLTEFF